MVENKVAEDLAFIRQIMDESRSFAEVGGMHFVNWGVVTAVGMLITWAIASRMLGGGAGSIFAVWIVALAGGSLLSYWRSRDERDAPVKHPVNRQIGAVWFAIGISMVVLFFGGQLLGAISPMSIPAIAAALLGAGIYVTGRLARIDWLRNLAFVWWVASIGLMLVRGAAVFLAYSLLIFALYIIPGIKLHQLARRAAN